MPDKNTSPTRFLATSLQRNTALAVLCLLALFWSAVAWNHQDAEQRALEEIRRETATLALLFANDVDNKFRSVDHGLLALRRVWVSSPAEMDNEAKEHIDYLVDSVLQVGIIGADGNLVYSNLGLPKEPLFLGEREHFKVHTGGLQDQLFVSRPLKGKVSGQWSIQLSRPIFRGAQFAGVVVISVDPNYFVKFYQNAGMGKDGAASMIRDTGEVMARSSGQDKFIGKQVKPSPYADPGAPLQGSFRRKAQVDGIERLSSYYRLPQYGLTVVVGPSLSERLVPLHSQQREIMVAAALITALVLLMAGLLMRAASRKEVAHQVLLKAEAAARDSNQRLNEIIWGTHVGTWEWNVQTGAVECNERCVEMLGYTLAELAPLSVETWRALMHPDDAKLTSDLLAQCFSRELGTYECHIRIRHKDGHWVWVSARGRVMEWAADGKPLRMAGTHHDISERKQAEEALRQSEIYASAIVQTTPACVKLVARDGTLLAMNAAGLAMIEASSEQAVIGRSVYGLLAPSCLVAFKDFNERVCGGASGSLEFELIGLKGARRWMETRAVPFQMAAGAEPVQLAITHDITDRKQVEEKILHMAQHDPLTGLANRALFARQLRRDLADARPDQTRLALLFMDLDKFKPVNDQHGHAVGDLLLQAVAQRLRACVRDSDILARIGGDEFVALLRDVADEPVALAVAEKIRASLDQPFALEGHCLNISCSVGVALYPQHGVDYLTLSKNADHAMYQAKERQRNQVVLYQVPQI